MEFEKLPLKKAFWKFIWPSVIAQWVFALYTMVDGMFVARGVSEVALSAVNIASPFVNFLFSVSILFAVGNSTIISICLGKGERKTANELYTQCLILLLIISAVIMAVVFFNIDTISVFLGATEETFVFVRNYILSIVPFAWCFLIAYSFEILVKTDGYPKFATMAVTTGAVTNCILDYLFVFVFDWGVVGAGVATGLSQFVLIFIYLSHFLSSKATMKFTKFKWDFVQIFRSIKIGLSSGLTEFSAGITVFLYNQTILKYLGNDGIISYTIIAYVNTIVVMSLAGIAQGAQPLVSFYYGKGEKDKYMKLLKYGIYSAMGLGIFAFAASIVGASPLVNIFISEDFISLREYTVGAFKIFALAFIVMGLNVQMSGFFTAIEKPVEAMIISMGRGLVTIAIALQICPLIWGGAGIWWSALVSEIMCGFFTVWFTVQYFKKIRRTK